MSIELKKCLFCTQVTIPNPYAAGWRSSVCAAHRTIACPLCGRQAIWTDGKVKHYSCNNLDCDFVSKTLPPKHRPELIL